MAAGAIIDLTYVGPSLFGRFLYMIMIRQTKRPTVQYQLWMQPKTGHFVDLPALAVRKPCQADMLIPITLVQRSPLL